MTLSRRLDLLRWAERKRSWILEDDYDSEYRYASRPVASLQGLDKSGAVIYCGTFSKVLFPSLRLGYIVVPASLVDAFRGAKAVVDRHCPTVEQAVLAEFIAEGHLARHIRRMRMLYLERKDLLMESLRRELGAAVEVRSHEAGMHVVGWLQKGMRDSVVSRRALELGVEAPASNQLSREARRTRWTRPWLCSVLRAAASECGQDTGDGDRIQAHNAAQEKRHG